MPIYEYRCTNCGHQLDALQKVSDEPLTVCPACSESTLVKKISAAGFRLKGGGWYETDFKSGKKRNVAGEAGASSPESGSSGEGTGGKPAEGAGRPAEGAGKPAESGTKSADGGKAGGGAKGSTSGSSSSSDAG